MSDQSSLPPNAGPAQPAPPRPRSRVRTALVVAAIALAGGFVGVTATRALSQGMFGHGFGHHGFMRGPMDPEKAQRRAERFARHLAVELDATTEQQEKLASTAREAIKDLLPVREEMRATRKRALELLAQPNVDRAAIEALRSEQIARADAASKRIARALGDAAEILTPEQRKTLAERIEERSERRGRGHGWWHRG